MSDKRVSEMTDDEVRGLADAAGTWKPDAYCEARQAIVRDAKAQGKDLITWKARPGACSDITYAEPLEGIRIALTRASAARRAVDDYVKIAREEGRTWAQVGQALGLAETAADRGVPMAEAAFEYVVPVREDSFRFARRRSAGTAAAATGSCPTGARTSHTRRTTSTGTLSGAPGWQRRSLRMTPS